jgi:hypothetical protein
LVDSFLPATNPFRFDDDFVIISSRELMITMLCLGENDVLAKIIENIPKMWWGFEVGYVHCQAEMTICFQSPNSRALINPLHRLRKA